MLRFWFAISPTFSFLIVLSVCPTTTKREKPLRSFSEVPSPKGACPIVGHQQLVKKLSQAERLRSRYLLDWFEELGPIFKLTFTGGNDSYREISIEMTGLYVGCNSAVVVLDLSSTCLDEVLLCLCDWLYI